MAAKILVAYTSRNGSTREIAEAVGKELTLAGYVADVMEMNSVTSVAGYTGIVIGAPLYMGNLVRDAGAFARKFKEPLTSLPVASFAVGLTPVSETVGNADHAMACLNSALAPINPACSILFAGRLDPTKLGFIQRKMMEIGRIPSGDFRDWDLIAAWARDLPGKMGLRP